MELLPPKQERHPPMKALMLEEALTFYWSKKERKGKERKGKEEDITIKGEDHLIPYVKTVVKMGY